MLPLFPHTCGGLRSSVPVILRLERLKIKILPTIEGVVRMTTAERRSNKRIPAKFKINYVHNEDYLISFSKDISVEGMFIYTENPPAVGDITKLTFSIGKLDLISVNAKVIWVNVAGLKKDAGMGVQFIDPPTPLKKNILEIINRVAVLPDMEKL